MAQAVDEAGNIWEVDAQGNAVRFIGKQGATQPNTIVTKQADPYARTKAANEAAASQYDPAMAAAELAVKQQQATIAAQTNAREQAKFEREQQKGPMANPQRGEQIKSLLDVIQRARTQSKDWMAVGEQSKRVRDYPLIGGILGQNRADVEGLVKSIEGDLIQQQIALLSQQNGGNGVASLANSETEAARMAAAIANLSLDQSLPEFLAGLDRAEAYYKRQIETLPDTPQNKEIRDAVAMGQRDDGAGMKTGNNGFDKYVTDEDRMRTAELQRAYDSGASISELNNLTAQLGLQPFSDADLKAMIDARTSGQPLAISPFATGTRTPTQQLLGDVASSNYGAATIAGTNAMTGGMLDEIVGATQGERAGQLAQYGKQFARDQNPYASLAGDIVGGVVLGGPLTAGVRSVGIRGVAGSLAPRVSQALAGTAPRAAITAGALQGAVTGAGEMNDSRLLGAGLGGTAGLAGGYAGGKLGNFLGTSPKVTSARNAVSNLVGKGRQRPQMPVLGQPQQMIVDAVGDRGPQVLDNLQNAASLGVPMTLADADPALRSLAGATVRRSPEARSIAEQAFVPRAQGQYDRLVGAINRDFGPTANVPQYSDDLIKKAQTAARPLYDQAYSAPGASSVDVSGIAATPMGQKGFRNAYDNVRNTLGPDGQPMDPTALGFDLNDAGEVALNRVPSFETLDYVKKGLDDIIESDFDPITKQYGPNARAAIGLKQRLVSQIDEVNPAYAEARAAYAGPAGEREALRLGQSSLNAAPDQMSFALKDMPQPRLEQFRLGYRSGLAEQAGKTRLASNPWESAYGSPQAQQRIGALFPDGAQNFGKQYGLERELAQSNNSILGNSMTAERMIADSQFGGNMLGDLAFDVATTGAPIKSSASMLGRLKKDELGRLGAKKKADELAPYLFAPDAADAAKFYKQMAKEATKAKKARGIFGSRSRSRGSLVAAAPSVGFTLGLTE